jgi:hypothetical protein
VSLAEGARAFARWFYDYYGPEGTRLAADEVAYKPL